MRGLIILDGPDGAGKTTLAEAIHAQCLKNKQRSSIHHLTKPQSGKAWEEHRDALLKYLHEAYTQDTVVIADRHFMSECIYGRHYREGSEYPHAARHVDRILHRFRALRVICAPPVEYIKKTYARLRRERVEMYDGGMEAIAKRYLDLWTGSSSSDYATPNDYIEQLTHAGGVYRFMGWYHYDVTSHPMDKVHLFADELLSELEDEQFLLNEQLYDFEVHRFTGFPHDRAVLLVGDRVNEDNLLHIPFFSNQGSSVYLAEQLSRLNVDESRVVMVNANDPAGESTVRLLTELCGRTIVLGRLAERTMLQRRIHFDASIRHPQAARRFSYHDHSYGKELKQALRGWASLTQ